MDIIGDSTLTSLWTSGVVNLTTANIASLTTNNVSVLTGTDCKALSGQGAVFLVAKNTSGTNATLAAKLAHAQDGDVVTSVTAGSNTGTGTLTEVYGGPNSVAEDITVTFTSASAFGVSGATSGAMAAGTVGTAYSSAIISFTANAGGEAFINGDTFVIVTTARTYADVAGGGFTTLTTANIAALTSVQIKPLDFDKLGRYLRPQVTLGGTSPAFDVAMFTQSATK